MPNNKHNDLGMVQMFKTVVKEQGEHSFYPTVIVTIMPIGSKKIATHEYLLLGLKSGVAVDRSYARNYIREEFPHLIIEARTFADTFADEVYTV